MMRQENEKLLNIAAQIKLMHIENQTILVNTDYGHPERAFYQKSRNFGFGQTFWAEIF